MTGGAAMGLEKKEQRPKLARRAFALAMMFAPAASMAADTTDNATGDATGEAPVRRFWNAFGLGAWDDLDALVLPTYRHHTSDSAMTLAGFKHGGAWLHRGLAGFVSKIDALVAEGDTVAVRWNAQGVHLRSFYGEPASGKVIVMRGMTFHRIEKGRIAEDWEVIDYDDFKRQLGAER